MTGIELSGNRQVFEGKVSVGSKQRVHIEVDDGTGGTALVDVRSVLRSLSGRKVRVVVMNLEGSA